MQREIQQLSASRRTAVMSLKPTLSCLQLHQMTSLGSPRTKVAPEQDVEDNVQAMGIQTRVRPAQLDAHLSDQSMHVDFDAPRIGKDVEGPLALLSDSRSVRGSGHRSRLAIDELDPVRDVPRVEHGFDSPAGDE